MPRVSRWMASSALALVVLMTLVGAATSAAGLPAAIRVPIPGVAPGDQAGSSVDRDGNWLVAGAVSDDAAGNAVGAVQVWEEVGFVRTHVAELTPSDAPIGGQFGYSVAVSGDTLVTGAPFADGLEGAAYVFRWNGSAWVEEQKLVSPTPAANDWFGWSVDIDADRVVVGAIGDDTAGSNRGAAYIFERSGSVWTLAAALIDNTAPLNAAGGYDVAIAGDSVAVGHPESSGFGGNGPGFVALYDRTGTAWTSAGTLVGPAPATGDNYGVALDSDGDRLAVGASGTQNTPGAAHVYDRTGGTWSLSATVEPTTEAGARVGFAVSIDGSLLAIGAFGKDGTLPTQVDAGAAWVYSFDGTSWAQSIEGTGSLAGDFYGRKVAVDGGAFAFGAPLDDNDATNGGAVFASPASPHPACGAASPILVDELIDDDGSITPGLCSIREAVAVADSFGGPAEVIVPAGSYALDLPGAGPIEISGNVTITGAGSASTTVDALGVSNHFFVMVGGDLYLSAIELTGGSTSGSGGALTIQGHAVLTDVVLDNNFGQNGGAIGIAGPDSSLVLQRSTLSNNTATFEGGGIDHSSAGPVLISNSTITGNTASQGGVMVTRGVAIGTGTVIENSTMVGNSASSDKGGITPVNLSIVVIRNSVLAANTAPSGPDCDIAIVSEGHNVFGACAGVVTPATGDQFLGSVSPSTIVGPLVDNGGPTPTMLPINPGPIVDSGNPAIPGSPAPACPALDQRNITRGPDRCDVGAVEVGSSSAAPVAVGDTYVVLTGATERLDVLENDFDPDGNLDESTLKVTTPASQGSATLITDSTGTAIEYEAGSTSSSDSFDYEVCDTTGACATATVAVTVLDQSDCTITGTTGADTLVGTSGDDVICGKGGADTIDAGDGNDVIFGGKGADIIHGGDGDDVLIGGRGADQLFGDAGNDDLLGGRGTDVLDGGQGADKLRGGRHADQLIGGEGADFLAGGRGADTLAGTGGTDLLRGNRGADQLFGGAGDDILRGGRGADTADGGLGIDDCQAETEVNCG